MLKGLPLTYGKDMQEDKEPLFDAADSIELCVAAMTGMVRDLKANPERMRAVASADYSVGDRSRRLAGARSRAAVPPGPPRDRRAGRQGRRARASISTSSRSPRCRRSSRGITKDVYRVLTVEASVAARKSYGGTAPVQRRTRRQGRAQAVPDSARR